MRRFGFPPLARRGATFTRRATSTPSTRARERIIFDEFFAIALAAAVKRARREAAGGAHALDRADGAWDAFVAQAAVRADRARSAA